MPVEIPVGYERVTSGMVQLGDQVYAQETKRFIEVTPTVLSHLGFLDAMAVEECVCVVRRSTSNVPS